MRDIRVGVDISEVTEHAKKHNAELGGVLIEENGERPDGTEFEIDD